MIPHETAKRIERALCGRYGVLLTHKTGALWAAVSAVFDVAKALGTGVPSGSSFTHDFATTLGVVVCLPDAQLTDDQMTALLVHECTHASQFVREPGKMAVQYLQHRERRAVLEAEAYAQGAAILWLLEGRLPARVEDMASALQWGYALTAEDCALAWGLLEQDATSIVAGVLPEGPCRVAASILARECPDVLNAEALALVRLNCPEALEAV